MPQIKNTERSAYKKQRGHFVNNEVMYDNISQNSPKGLKNSSILIPVFFT